jgi:hypothetical protein
MTLHEDFLSDSAVLSNPERDVLYCLTKKDYAKTLQRLLEETDTKDKEEVLVSPRFTAAVLQRMYQEVGIKTPKLISFVADFPTAPEEYAHLPRIFAVMVENGMMGIQVSASEEWVAEGVEIEMKQLLNDTAEEFTKEERAFFRLRAKGNYYFYARAYISAWGAFQEAEQILPGRLVDHPAWRRANMLVEGTKLGVTLSQKPLHRLTEVEEATREEFQSPEPSPLPILEKMEVDQPIGQLKIQGRYGVLIEDADQAFLEEAFENLPASSVKQIELRFCRLTEGKLPRVFFRFPNLTHLTIDSCGLARLTNNLAGFKKLRHLTIINAGKLENLPLKLGGLTRLESLVVDRSGLTDIPFSILECKHLQKLSITSSRLTYVNGFLGELGALTEANFSHNHIDEVEDGFMDTVRLRLLDLSYNRLRELPENLHALTVLESLNISQNPLVKVPAGIIYMNALKLLKIDAKTIGQLDQYLSFKNDLKDKIATGERLWSLGQGLW